MSTQVYEVEVNSDVALGQMASPSVLGDPVNVNIPEKGRVSVLIDQIRWDNTGGAAMAQFGMGVKVNGVNHIFGFINNGTFTHHTVAVVMAGQYQSIQGCRSSAPAEISVQGGGLNTGEQELQILAFKVASAAGPTVKGSILPARFFVIVEDYAE